jgi:molecular chaperone GrpE
LEPSEPLPTLETVANGIEQLRTLLEDRARSDDAARLAVRHLHTEMEHYKQDFLFQSQKSLLLDILAFHDSLCWFRNHAAQPDTTPQALLEGVQYLLDEILELLYRQDVVPIEPQTSFDRTVQKAVQLVWTDDPSMDQSIHRVIRRGFLRNGRILRPEEVVVWRTRKANQGEVSSEESDVGALESPAAPPNPLSRS